MVWGTHARQTRFARATLRTWARAGLRTLACIAALLAPLAARAQPLATAEQRALAQALFDDARRLMGEGNHEAACPKLEESQRLDPGVGTQFNLATCYEAIGKSASAWSLYLEVASSAHRAAEQARERVARERAAQLEPKLSRLKIIVPEAARVTGLRVERAQAEVGTAQWGAPLPIDPGRHVVRASAPGKKPVELEVQVPADGSTYTVTLDPLPDAPIERAGTARDRRSFWQKLGTQRIVGASLAAGGLLALGTAGVFTLLAVDADAASEDNCEGDRCNEQGVADRDDALAHSDRATVAAIAGGALIAAGAVLFLTGAPDERPTPTSGTVQARLQPFASHTLAGVQLEGSF